MRQTVLVCVALLSIPSTTMSQAIRHLGLKTGVVLADQQWGVYPGDEAPTSSQPGFAIGLFVEWLQLPVFSLSTEFQYSMTGLTSFSISEDGGPTFYFDDPRFEYFSIPVLAKMRMDAEEASLYLLLGARFDFLSATSQYSGYNFFEDFGATGVGGMVGLGVDFSATDEFMFGIEFRYAWRFSGISTTPFAPMQRRSFEILLTTGV